MRESMAGVIVAEQHRVHDVGPARAGHPDAPTFLTAVQLAAAALFAYKGHQSAEDSWHGAGDYHAADASA